MKLSDFIALTEEQKRNTVLHQGVALAKRELFQHMVFLFQLQNYYVETYCSRETKLIEEYRVFHDPEFLSPYLEAIAIDDLFQ